MSKFTPGPWTADKTRVYIGDNPKDVGSEANARLIAAAPEMLALLNEVECYCPIEVQDEIRALRAKIEAGIDE